MQEKEALAHKELNITKVATRMKGYTIRQIQRVVRKALFYAYYSYNQSPFFVHNKHFDKAFTALKEKTTHLDHAWTKKAKQALLVSLPYAWPIITSGISIWMQYQLNKKGHEWWMEQQKPRFAQW